MKNKTVVRSQLPVTPAYAFTDYRSQGQTIRNAIIDIAPPPTGALTPFNIYVAFEYLRLEDERLNKLDKETERWWNNLQAEQYVK
ncbi:hypothetical protein EV363DRAFT_1394800 [Boletus edulis]|uniref:Uncharacterized protein n=1 Tax=Boletus edulis BED1 TaxID=1328754 RepID=A0AAD4BAT6_BOLED|nr:hypothetical protein EV363DRAFT_1394800 [Boletus edulis]KAF8416202.1 hypothetical protein L210DRAFT_3429764 [Boletus edulis BED1]